MTDNNQPLVSIIVLAYNHESFIKNCLESIFSQDFKFRAEIIIGEDCSSDNTIDIIQVLTKDLKIPVHLIQSEKNVGLIKNFLRCIKSSRGKYIALCSGDDFWIDNNKINKQLTFLEENEDYGLVYTNYNVLNDNTKNLTEGNLTKNGFKTPSGYLRDDLILGIQAILHITSCYRRSLLDQKFFEFMDDEKFLAEDFPLFMWLGFDYKVKYLDDITAVYRTNDKSITGSMSLCERWEFTMSFVYMREKFLKEKKYKPLNWISEQITTNNYIINFAFRHGSFNNYVLDAYKNLKKMNAVSMIIMIKYHLTRLNLVRLLLYLKQSCRNIRFY
jgi:glycosyltransferase involved in cell wall biosynthesis